MALAVPTMLLSKKPVDQTWQGTKVPPRMPMKNRRAMSSLALYAVPDRKVGIAPTKRQLANVLRGPKRSHAGPATRRTSRVATSAIIFELAIWCLVSVKSLAMVTVNCGGNQCLDDWSFSLVRTNGGKAYHDQNAIMKPNHE